MAIRKRQLNMVFKFPKIDFTARLWLIDGCGESTFWLYHHHPCGERKDRVLPFTRWIILLQGIKIVTRRWIIFTQVMFHR